MADIMTSTGEPDIEQLKDALIDGDRSALARAITLVESHRADHQSAAAKLLQAVLAHTGNSIRIGVTGVPGAGKSTFIESLGSMLTGNGLKVAVLAVDPSSLRSRGSILGDKTRMSRLAVDDRAFIRPSPSGGRLGGVAARTREAILLCEAAGFDVIIVETVGAGQSEIAVADMVDSFLILMLPGAGDELQGIKKGALELADVIAVNKIDRDKKAAGRAAGELKAALKIITPGSAAWQPPVVMISALKGDGLKEVWSQVEQHRATLKKAGHFEEKRRNQRVRWMWSLIEDRLINDFRSKKAVKSSLSRAEEDVRNGDLAPSAAAEELLKAFRT